MVCLPVMKRYKKHELERHESKRHESKRTVLRLWKIAYRPIHEQVPLSEIFVFGLNDDMWQRVLLEIRQFLE